MQEVKITALEAGQRFDKMLAKYLNKAPKSFLYKMLRKKNITLNDKKASGNEIIREGDIIKLFLADETIGKFSGVQIVYTNCELDIIFENEDVLIINKPVGMLSQKAKETDESMVEHVISYLLRTKEISEQTLATFRPSICNRLDRNTSGLITAGKTLAGLQELNQLFKDRRIEKYYLCLVVGSVKEKQRIKGYLHKNKTNNRVTVTSEEQPGSAAIETEYDPIAVADDNVTLLRVHLITGKTHQIRAHLSASGFPLIGDYKYGDRSVNQRFYKAYGVESQLLHAHTLKFPDCQGVLKPLSGLTFQAELPDVFKRICQERGLGYGQK